MSQKVEYNIKTEEDFNQVLELIDTELRNENVPVTARQIKGWLKFSSRFGLGLMISDPLSKKVMDWFEKRYGDKLKIDFVSGDMPALIRGDLYKLRIPRMYGTIQVICDPSYWGISHQNKLDPNTFPMLNVLDFVEGLTEDYARTLDADEKKYIADLFLAGYYAFDGIDQIKGNTFVTQATGDINAALSHMFDAPPKLGLSKWASLQALEKLIKAYIDYKGGAFPFSHDLQRLATLAQTYALPALNPNDLNKVQCAAEIRYGGIPVSLNEAVDAYCTALKMCQEIAKNF